MIDATLFEDVDTARRLAFVLAEAEVALGISAPDGLTLGQRIEGVLLGAMERPEAISAASYAALYNLRDETGER